MKSNLAVVAMLGVLVSSIGAQEQTAPKYSTASKLVCTDIPTLKESETGVISSKEAFGVINSTIKVDAEHAGLNSTEGFERHISMEEVRTSAGTFGDPTRFLQMLPGVVSDNDQRNDFLVRGGNPSENLFLIDNIEIPSINQLALSDTTGGFVSMIDNVAVQRMSLHTDAYDSKFDQRLSSVLEISTLPDHQVERVSTVEAGIAGFGGAMTRPIREDGSLFISARQSLLHLFTNDIGLNGVPKYQNEIVRANRKIDDNNNWWGLSLTGVDSISINPSAKDAYETNPFDISYRGWRNTSGLNWQHLFSSRSFITTSIANSQQTQNVLQKNQLNANAVVYDESTSDGITTFKSDWMMERPSWLTFTAGIRTSINRINYDVQQPIGLPSPYNESPRPTDAASFHRAFASSANAIYSQGSFPILSRARITVGQRFAHWSLGGHTEWTPKALISSPIFGRLVHLGYAEYAQAVPTLYLLSFDNQRRLKPMRVQQITSGIDVFDNTYLHTTLEIYQKKYFDYPVALYYPQLSMANIADTFGQAFLMFPMTDKGSGIARGVELSAEAKPSLHLRLNGTVTYARSWYSGLDGILRRGNFDLPFVANLGLVWNMGRNTITTVRYGTASGRPYTPDNLALSFAQNRDVYDLEKINSLRSAAYNRLDFRLEHSNKIRQGTATWHIGLQNALGTSNFYSNQWRPRCPKCGVLQQDQMPRFPDGGIQYRF
jgi:hypothetical protein